MRFPVPHFVAVLVAPDVPYVAALQNLYKDFESLDMAEKVLTPCFSSFAVTCHEVGLAAETCQRVTCRSSS